MNEGGLKILCMDSQPPTVSVIIGYIVSTLTCVQVMEHGAKCPLPVNVHYQRSGVLSMNDHPMECIKVYISTSNTGNAIHVSRRQLSPSVLTVLV